MKVFEKVDNEGNILRREGTAIFLKLKREKRTRRIGDINNRILYMTRKRNRHIHVKSNSYGFNHWLLDNAKLFDYIVIQDEMGAYKIKKDYIVKKGDFLFFKQTGFEKQIFLSVEDIERFKI